MQFCYVVVTYLQCCRFLSCLSLETLGKVYLKKVWEGRFLVAVWESIIPSSHMMWRVQTIAKYSKNIWSFVCSEDLKKKFVLLKAWFPFPGLGDRCIRTLPPQFYWYFAYFSMKKPLMALCLAQGKKVRCKV